MEQSVLKNYAKYVSLNILGMIGLSCYILADTFFVSKALGAAEFFNWDLQPDSWYRIDDRYGRCHPLQHSEIPE